MNWQRLAAVCLLAGVASACGTSHGSTSALTPSSSATSGLKVKDYPDRGQDAARAYATRQSDFGGAFLQGNVLTLAFLDPMHHERRIRAIGGASAERVRLIKVSHTTKELDALLHGVTDHAPGVLARANLRLASAAVNEPQNGVVVSVADQQGRNATARELVVARRLLEAQFSGGPLTVVAEALPQAR